MTETPEQSVSLSDAAHQARMTWHSMYNAVLRGDVEGRRVGVNRRWVVDAASLERFIRERSERLP